MISFQVGFGKKGKQQQLEAPAGWFLAQGVLEPQETQEGFC